MKRRNVLNYIVEVAVAELVAYIIRRLQGGRNA